MGIWRLTVLDRLFWGSCSSLFFLWKELIALVLKVYEWTLMYNKTFTI